MSGSHLQDCNAAGRFDGWVSLARAAAVQRWFGGDAKAVDDADARATALALRWYGNFDIILDQLSRISQLRTT